MEKRLCAVVSQDAQTAFMFLPCILSLDVVRWLYSPWLFIAVAAVLCKRQKDEAVMMCVSCVESVLC